MREWMKQARKEAGLTMKESADKLGISESYYSMIEQGKRQPNLDMALASKLSQLFNMPLQLIAEQEKRAILCR